MRFVENLHPTYSRKAISFSRTATLPSSILPQRQVFGQPSKVNNLNRVIRQPLTKYCKADSRRSLSHGNRDGHH